jgi:anti-sigma factor RsiW
MTPMMNHDEAVRDHLAEGYLLGDLSRETRDAFEEHYFDCQECANDVRASFDFAGALRSSGAAQADPFLRRQIERMKRRLVIPLAAAASLLVATLGWMELGLVRPLQTAAVEARKPHVVRVYPLEAFRGGEAATPSASETYQLEVPVPADGSTRYACVIVDAHGAARYTLPVSAAQTADFVRIDVPAGTLEPGKYTLRVDGKKPKIAEYSFTVR